MSGIFCHIYILSTTVNSFSTWNALEVISFQENHAQRPLFKCECGVTLVSSTCVMLYLNSEIKFNELEKPSCSPSLTGNLQSTAN